MWGGMRSQIKGFTCDPLADLAVGKLEPFDPNSIGEYPVFKNPSEDMPAGTSLCRLGFPFHNIHASFDSSTKQFKLAPGVLPVPRFPNDGIHTRLAVMSSPDGTRQAHFIETSTPGLRGQSGGPILDANGHVWAIQSQTHSLPLGFSPTVKQGNKEVIEHQFMHVGLGSHAREIIRMLTSHNARFKMSGAVDI
jgi:hypothetical protein